MPRLHILMLAAILLSSAPANGECTQIFRPPRETMGMTNLTPLQEIDDAAWIWSADSKAAHSPAIVRFRKDFTSDGTEMTIDLSADERYAAALDGKVFSRGPHRGTVGHWNYQTYKIVPAPGRHVLEVTVAWLGAFRPLAQASWRGGFVLKASGAYDEQLTTGKAKWESAVLTGTSCWKSNVSTTNGQVGWPFKIRGASWIDERPAEYTGVRVVRSRVKEMMYGTRAEGWMLFPTIIPDQLETASSPGRIRRAPNDYTRRFNELLTNGRPVEIPPHSTIELMWDLEDYFCAYPEITVSGGADAEIEWLWDESLRDRKGKKGNRFSIDGKSMTRGFGDRFYPNGSQRANFTVPWWRSGRWCRINIKTNERPLTIHKLAIRETRYPIIGDSLFKCDDPDVGDIAKICRRSIECCTHETLYDCPHWEQAMYSGDCRIELAALSALTQDERMRRLSLSMFNWSRRNDGLVPMATPLPGGKDSSTYTMYWIMMFGDYARYGSDGKWLRSHIPGMRFALDALSLYEDDEGLLRDLPGWNYVDHMRWPNGIPPGGRKGEPPGCIVNLLYLSALQSASLAEDAILEELMSERWKAKSARLSSAIADRFYDAGNHCLSDSGRTPGGIHADCLGVLTGVLRQKDFESVGNRLSQACNAGKLSMGAHFRHYLFKAVFKIGRPDIFWSEMKMWRAMVDAGLCTTTETGGIEARSDCHAWSASPLFFLHAGIAGVRPHGSFWSSARIAPQPGILKRVYANTPTPKGYITVDFHFHGDNATGTIMIPPNLSCDFIWKGRTIPLHPGANAIGNGEDCPRR